MTATLLDAQLLSRLSPGSPEIINLTLTDANTEYSQALPAKTVRFCLQARDSSMDLKLAFAAGESGSKYLTIHGGQVYYEDVLSPESLTLYLQSPSSGAVVEILVWRI